MYRSTFRVLTSLCVAAVLALTLAACGGDEEAEPTKPPAEKVEESTKPVEVATEVTYSCSHCLKGKKVASDAPAPSC